jgi:tetratricopeptide (TPR) repeat protein
MIAAKNAFPDDPKYRILLALLQHKVGNYDASIAEYNKVTKAIVIQKALKLSSYRADILIGRGNVYSSSEQFTKARRDYQRVIHVDPRSYKAFINIAFSYQAEGNFKRAWSVFTTLISMDSGNSEAYEGRAIVHLSMKNIAGALIDIGKAIVNFRYL